MKHVEACKAAAEALGVSIDGPVKITESDFDIIVADMLFKDFWSINGTLVFESDDIAQVHAHLLLEMGYSYTSFDEPIAALTIDDLREMLLDWTWCGPEGLRPDWA